MTLKQILGTAKELSTWIHGHTNEGDYPNNPGLALLQQSQDICDAIIILIDEKLPGPAYALARPMLILMFADCGYSIQPNYPEEELIRLMQIQIGIQLAIGTHLLALGNNQAGIEKLEEMAQQYGTAVRGI